MCVCVDYWDINHACPKENYPTLFIDQIVNDCARSEVFLLWMVFLATIRSKFSHRTNIKLHFFSMGHIFISKSPF